MIPLSIQKQKKIISDNSITCQKLPENDNKMCVAYL